MHTPARTRVPRRAILALSIASLLGAHPGAAATFTWNGPVDEAWDTTSNNWDPTAALPWNDINGFSNQAVFNTPALAAVVNGVVYTNAISFNASGALGDGTITLGGTTPTITTADGVTGTIASSLSGAGGFTKIGNGTLVLQGVNSFTGALNVAGGKLRVESLATALGNGSVALAGGALEIGSDFDLAFGRDVTVAANSIMTSDAQFTGGGAATHTFGALSIGGQTLTITRGANASFGTGGITFGATTLTGNATFDVQTNARLNLGAIVGAANGLSKSGAGTLVLTGNNTYAGMTTILEGTLQLNNASALKAGNAITLGGAGAVNPTLVINSGQDASLGAITVPANVTGATVSMPDNTATKTYTIAGATVNSAITFAQSNATSPRWSQVVWSSKITGAGAGSGNDTLVFNNTSGMQNYYTTNSGVLHDFSGNVRLKAGLVAVQSGNAGGNLCIPDASMLILDAGEWRWNTGSMVETVDGLAGAGTMGNPGNLTLTINANNPDNNGTAESPKRSFSGTLGNLKSGGVLSLGGSGTQEFSGTKVTYNNNTNLDNGTLRLTKTTAWGSNIAMGSANSPTLQLNAPTTAAADTWTFSKQINSSAANLNAKVEKIGAGTVILNPAAGSSFAGSSTAALLVTAGRLYLNSTGFTNAPAVAVASGATFGGSGTAGNITVANGANFEGGYNGSGTLTAGNVTLGAVSSDTVTLSGTLSTTTGYKPIAVTNLTINGGNQSVILNASGLGLVSGAYYDLLVSANPIAAPNASSVLAALKSNARAYTPNVNGNTIRLYYDADASVYWTGAVSSVWDSSATNWKLKGNNGDTQFLTNDVVEFRDSPLNSTVDITSADVSPAVVTFTNTAATQYILQGLYGIATGRINKSGNGTVIITNTNPTSGDVTLTGGLVTMSQAGGLGSGNLIMDGGSLQYTGLDTSAWTRSVTVNMGGGKIDVQDPGATISTSGALGGAGTLTKAGPGALAFSGAGAFASNLVVSGGLLLAKHANAFGTGAATLVLGDANTGANPVEVRVDNGVNAALPLATLSNSNYGSSQTVTINAGSGLGANAAALVTEVHLDGSVPLTFKATNTNSHSTAQDVNARFVGTGIPAGQTALILDGSSYSLRFSQMGNASAASNFTGDVIILGNVTTQGRTYLATTPENQNLTFLNNNIMVSNGATWTVVWGGETIGALNGQGTVVLNNQNALNNIGLTMGNNNRDGVFTGTFGRTWGIAKVGTGTQTLSGFGITYTGATTVNNGRLILQDASLFSSPSAAINGGTLEINNSMEFDWPVATAFSGAGNLEKTGNGPVTLTGASAGFTGATAVKAGSLVVNGNLSGSAIMVHAATLGGVGPVGTVTILPEGQLSPGTGPGILQTSGLNLAGLFDMEMYGVTPGAEYDQVNVTGAVNLSGATLGLALNTFVPEHGSMFFLVANDGDDAVNGTFAGLAGGSIFDLGEQKWQISYTANFQNGVGDAFTGGNDIALMAVPEPSAALLGGLGLVAMAVRRRRTIAAT